MLLQRFGVVRWDELGPLLLLAVDQLAANPLYEAHSLPCAGAQGQNADSAFQLSRFETLAIGAARGTHRR